MATNPPARIFFLLARKANKAVVFRRGPTKWTQMVAWNLNDDTLEYGQWSKIKLRPRRCDLSPTGKYLIYLDDQFENGDSTTAISKPPYWTTLCKWRHDAPLYGAGGGLFKNETELQLNGIASDPETMEGHLPPHFKIGMTEENRFESYHLWKGHINPLLEVRLSRDGWKAIEDKGFIESETSNMVHRSPSKLWNDVQPESMKPMAPQLFGKQITKSSFLWMITYYHSDLQKTLTTFYIKKREVKTKLEGITWADVDHNGRIIGTKEGQLYASKRFKDSSVQLSNLEMLHDLNAQKPTEVTVPDEMREW